MCTADTAPARRSPRSGGILTARGFVTPQPHKRPRASFVRLEAVQPNERWQVNLTHRSLADVTDTGICNWLDDHSRDCLGAGTAEAPVGVPGGLGPL